MMKSDYIPNELSGHEGDLRMSLEQLKEQVVQCDVKMPQVRKVIIEDDDD